MHWALVQAPGCEPLAALGLAKASSMPAKPGRNSQSPVSCGAPWDGLTAAYCGLPKMGGGS